MHELSVCQSLLREVDRVARTQGAQQVTSIAVAVGPLSGVEPSLLKRAFEIARAGTLASNAVLQIEPAPVIVFCQSCAVETPASPNALLCGSCGTWRVEMRSGDELVIKTVELTATA